MEKISSVIKDWQEKKPCFKNKNRKPKKKNNKNKKQ